MKKIIIALGSFCLIIVLSTCKKDEQTSSTNNTVVNLINTFGPNDSYTPTSGWNLGYSSPSSWVHAIGFTPDVTGKILQYTIAVYRKNGGNQLNAWLRTDAGNTPGELIEQFSFVVPSGSNDLKLSSNSAIHPQLIRGTIYWLVVAPSDITTELFLWYRNPPINGILDAQGNNPNGPWNFMGKDYAPTLRITGNAN